MITPASLLTLGIAALTSGWVLYENWSRKSAKATGEVGNAMEAARKAASEYVSTLQSVERARLEGIRNAQQESVELKVLYGITQDTTLSIEQRQKAVDALQKQYPSYFGNLKDEAILAGNAKEQYDQLSKSIIATARSRAAMEGITENEKERFAVIRQIGDLEDKINAKQLRLQDQRQQNERILQKMREKGMNREAQEQAAAFAQNEQLQQNGINDLIAEKNKLDERNAKLGADSLKLQKYVNAEVAKGADLTGSDTKAKKEQLTAMQELEKAWNAATAKANLYGSEIDNQNGAFKTYMATLSQSGDKTLAYTQYVQTMGLSFDAAADKTKALQSAIDRLISEGAKPTDSRLQTMLSYLNALNNVDLTPMQNSLEKAFLSANGPADMFLGNLQKVSEQIAATFKNISDSQKAFFDEQAAISLAQVRQIETVAGMINGAVTESLTGLGELMGQAMAGMSVTAGGFAQAILTPIADLAIQLGKYAIGIGIGVEAIKKSLANFTGVGAIAAGVALVALGSAAKAALGGMAGGGAAPSVNTSSVSGVGGFNAGSDVGGPSEFVFKIAGNDLVAVMQRTQYKTQRTRG